MIDWVQIRFPMGWKEWGGTGVCADVARFKVDFATLGLQTDSTPCNGNQHYVAGVLDAERGPKHQHVRAARLHFEFSLAFRDFEPGLSEVVM
jgi:hypothetical protein